MAVNDDRYVERPLDWYMLNGKVLSQETRGGRLYRRHLETESLDVDTQNGEV